MGLIKDIINDWRHEKKNKRSAENQTIGWNIYGAGETLKEHQTKFRFIHMVWKYKIFMPFVRIFARLMGRHLITKVPDEPHNVNIKIFHEAVEKAIHTWVYEYIKKAYKKPKSDEWAEKFMKSNSPNIIRMARDTMITMFLNDTVYREYFNIFAHTLAKGMVEHHSKNPDKKTGHLFFTHADVFDVDYYMLFKKVETQKHMALHNVDQQKYAEQRKELEEKFKNQGTKTK